MRSRSGHRRFGVVVQRRVVLIHLVACGVLLAHAPGARADDAIGPHEIRVASGSTWAGSDCDMNGATGSYWTTPVMGLQVTAVDDDFGYVNGAPYQSLNWPSGDPLIMGTGLGSTTRASFNWVNSSTTKQTATINGNNWSSNSEYSKASWTSFLGKWYATSGLMKLPMPSPANVKFDNTSDTRATVIDSSRCVVYELYGWDRYNGSLGTRKMRGLTILDPESNYRRLSSMGGWLSSPFNSSSGRIDSPVAPNQSGSAYATPADGVYAVAPRGGGTSAGGSGTSRVLGAVRVDEVFATPISTDVTVAEGASINHVISAVLPAENVTTIPEATSLGSASSPVPAAPFVWPATSSDGCGGGGTCVGDAGGSLSSGDHLPMGSRLRLEPDKCDAFLGNESNHAQARVIVQALCSYGIVVVDSSVHFNIDVEGSAKWSRDAGNQLSTLTLRDFELVDTTPLELDQGPPENRTTRTSVVWSAAVELARAKLASAQPPGSNPFGTGSGWYSGWFWRQVVTCRQPGSDGALACNNSIVEPVDSMINAPEWYKVADPA